jgi:hypothetical protein
MIPPRDYDRKTDAFIEGRLGRLVIEYVYGTSGGYLIEGEIAGEKIIKFIVGRDAAAAWAVMKVSSDE